jgi:proteasome lid subunit RPN8/RPN11
VRPGTHIRRDVLAIIRAAARAEYPNECCGVLVGRDDAVHGRFIAHVAAIPNERRGRQFLIEDHTLRAADSAAAQDGSLVLGFFHSHPDARALPSETDLALAWPWYTYVIVSAPAGDEIAAWRLRDDRSGFEGEPLYQEE